MLSRPLVLDALLPHGSLRRVHTQGDDETLAVFRLDPLQLRLLCWVTVLALGGQGGGGGCMCRQHVQGTRCCCGETVSQSPCVWVDACPCQAPGDQKPHHMLTVWTVSLSMNAQHLFNASNSGLPCWSGKGGEWTTGGRGRTQQMALVLWPRGCCWLLLDAGPEPRRGLGCSKLSLHLSHIPAPSLSREGSPASPRLASPQPSTQAHPLSGLHHREALPPPGLLLAQGPPPPLITPASCSA